MTRSLLADILPPDNAEVLNPRTNRIDPLDIRLTDASFGYEHRDVITKARLMAVSWHKDQKRKYTDEPYVNHPIQVANMLNFFWQQTFKVNAPIDMLVAALLHDVVEDCGATYEEIDNLFGSAVTELVFWLTDDVEDRHGSRALRKGLARSKMKHAPMKARILKHFDCHSNRVGMQAGNPEHYAKVYKPELDALEKDMETDTYNDLLVLVYKVRRESNAAL